LQELLKVKHGGLVVVLPESQVGHHHGSLLVLFIISANRKYNGNDVTLALKCTGIGLKKLGFKKARLLKATF
jgi:hypothetical protein